MQKRRKPASQPIPLYASFTLGDKTAVNSGRAAGTVRVQKGLETLGEVLAQKPKCQVLCVGLVATLMGKVGNSLQLVQSRWQGKGLPAPQEDRGVKGVSPRCA